MNIIQIGANSGNDHVYEYIKTHQHSIQKAILVEPMPLVVDDLKKQYEGFTNVIIEQVAITIKQVKSVVLYYDKQSPNFQVSTLNRKHLVDHGCPEDWITSTKVKALTFDQLMAKHNMMHLEYLFIDAEGMDIPIINNIDLTKYRINNIVFEAQHADGVNTRAENLSNLINRLNENNYTVGGTNDPLSMIATYKGH